MPYLTGFRNDVFISYASADNQAVGDEPGWVDRFHRCLQPELTRLLGSGGPSVWYDEVDLGGDAGLEDARETIIQDSAIFIAVTSPSYLKSRTCQRDLRLFHQHSEKHGGILVERRSRIFRVRLYYDYYDIPYWELPEELQSGVEYDFYDSPDNPLQPGDRKFESELRQLARDIVHMLEVLAQQGTDSGLDSRTEDEIHEIESESETEELVKSESETEELIKSESETEELVKSESETEELVFVCYAREDEEFVLSLAKTVKQHGVRIWIDQWDIPASADWDHSIDEALFSCDRFLIVLSPSAVGSNEVRTELRTALDEKKCIVPVLHQQCRIPRTLRLTQHINFLSAAPDDETRIAQLLHALKLPK